MDYILNKAGLTVRAKSSEGEPYNVTFESHDGRILVFCSCKAGVVRMMCKHKLALMKCDASMLADESEAEKLNSLKSWAEYAALSENVIAYDAAMEEIENEKYALTKKEKALKVELAKRIMK